MKVKFKRLNENAVMPEKARPTDAGFDLVATSREIDEYGNIMYGTGLAVEIPEGYVGLAFPRSSVSKYDIVMANSTGIIDAHFRGEMKFKFKMAIEAGKLATEGAGEHIFAQTTYPKNRVYNVGDRIAQLIIMPIPEIEFEEADELTATDRGDGGYGSTGK